VKVMLKETAADEESVARFRTEARAAAAIGHPGIAEVIDFGVTPEGGAYLVMEYLEGETLGGRLRRAGPLDVETVGWLADELLSAVAAAHGKGVIHRDLKPDNVFLADQPRRAVKILDFGVSKFRQPGDVSLTKTGTVMGTPAYMSPEQARGSKTVGPATDLYAVGAILYEALTGAAAFSGESYNEILAKVLTEPYAPLAQIRSDVPPALVALVDRLLAKLAADRPGDAQEARALLSHAMKGGGLSADLGSPTLRPGASAPAPSGPAFAPTARTPAARVPAGSAPEPAAAPSLPPPAPPSQPPPPETVAPAIAKKRGLRWWIFWALLVLLGIRGCKACRSCCRDEDRRPSFEEADERPDADEVDDHGPVDAGSAHSGFTLPRGLQAGNLELDQNRARIGNLSIEQTDAGLRFQVVRPAGLDAGAAAGPDAGGADVGPSGAMLERAPAESVRERRERTQRERRELLRREKRQR